MAAPAIKTTAPWCTIDDLPARATDGKFELDIEDGGEVENWIQIASDVLFNFTRRQWPGATTVTVRPAVREDGCTYSTRDGVSEILLPNPPVVSITEVKIDGDVVDASAYRVDNWRRLVYIPSAGDTRSAWPSWQDQDQPDSASGTFSVTYIYGTPPPAGGVQACAALATELAISASPKLAGQARLPARTTNVSRQGVSAASTDPATLFEDGQTGVDSVDLWLGSIRYGAKNRSGRIRRFGQNRTRRAT